jgi:hypothetical protein
MIQMKRVELQIFYSKVVLEDHKKSVRLPFETLSQPHRFSTSNRGGNLSHILSIMHSTGTGNWPVEDIQQEGLQNFF